MTTSTPETHTTITTGPGPAPVAAFVAAAGLAVTGVISLIHHTGDDHWDTLSQVLNGAYALAALALVAALPGLTPWLRLNRVGRAGIVVAQVGCAAMVVESVVSGIHDGSTLGGLFFAGLVLTLLGQLVVGVTGLVAGHRRWAAMLPFLGLLVGMAGGEHGGFLVTAVVWVVLGSALRGVSRDREVR